MPIIEIKNLGKKYNISHYQGGYIALRDVLTNTIKSPLKFLKSKTKQIIGKETKEEFWALKNINFAVEKGEAIGIIGSNGAGKSTLLKILTGITPPTTGEARLKGSVASLLEVGTGFHPELTGRENIFLNGAILGMSQKEIAKKFDAIVEFSGVAKFLDTPVKRYSSGMYVRLAFSVAAHMDPDILLVDEVLAVGDADFQKKCLGKMDEVTKAAGRTILFVSHNMTAIQSLCQKAILLENGQIKKIGGSSEVVAEYMRNNPLSQDGSSLRTRRDRKGDGNIIFTSFFVESGGKRVDYLIEGGNYTFCFEYEALDKKVIDNLECASAITLENGEAIALNWTRYTKQSFLNAPAKGVIRCEIKQRFPLSEGLYSLSANLFNNGKQEDYFKNLGVFEVKQGDFYKNDVHIKHSPFLLEQDWSVSGR